MEQHDAIATLNNPDASAVTVAEAAWAAGTYEVQRLNPDRRTYVYACLYACGFGLYGGLADIAPILMRPRCHIVRDERGNTKEPSAAIVPCNERWLIVNAYGPTLEGRAVSSEERLALVRETLHHLNPNNVEDRLLAAYAAAILNIR